MKMIDDGFMRMVLACMVALALLPRVASAEEGVTDTEIRIGTVLDLEGVSQGLGRGMLQGMKAAFKGQKIGERSLVLVSKNDFYTPEKAMEATNELIEEGVFLFAGNVGTPTANAVLPLLAGKKIPAVGFFTGAGLLRPGEGDIINFRASYVQEVGEVIKEALGKDVDPQSICAFVQNDSYGMSGIQGIQAALKGKPGVELMLAALDDVLKVEGDAPQRNGIGPVGVYTRNSFVARDGYNSLKDWEKKQGKPCRLVVTVGSYETIGRFVAYVLGKGEPWIFSAVSFTGAGNFLDTLKQFDVDGRVVMTQVVPQLDLPLQIVLDARAALKADIGQVSLEGYIVGRLLVYGLAQLEAEGKPITRANLLEVYRGKQFDLGGLNMDFTQDNQGSDFVGLTVLSGSRWESMNSATWKGWYE